MNFALKKQFVSLQAWSVDSDKTKNIEAGNISQCLCLYLWLSEFLSLETGNFISHTAQ